MSAKPQQDLEKKTRTATPIRRALRYIITCVMHETEPLPRHFSDSPIHVMIYKTWKEQECIGWGHSCRGRTSSKWAQAQEIYYQDHPDTRDANFYSYRLWAKRIIGQLIEISLQLWVARNKELHGTTPEDQRQLQRVRTISLNILL